jgi:hypothetical protein
MRANSRMQALLSDDAFVTDKPDLPAETEAIIRAGWRVGPGGDLVLAAVSRESPLRVSPSEIGGHEYEVNDVYISLDDLRDDPATLLARAASRGLSFATEMLKSGLSLPGSETLTATVSLFIDMTDEDFALQGTVVRFFTRRGDSPEWFQDLEAFTMEATAVLDAADLS